MPLKNIIVFYLLVLVPLILLAIGIMNHFISKGFFFAAIFIYALLYHPLISGLRLLALGKIKKSELWLNFIPFWNQKYFKLLFFNK
jgi:hypothetical protein